MKGLILFLLLTVTEMNMFAQHPNHGDFMVYIGNEIGDRCNYQLFNNLGRKIVEGTWLTKTKKIYRVNINGLETGIYFLQIRDKKYSIGEKVIIIK